VLDEPGLRPHTISPPSRIVPGTAESNDAIIRKIAAANNLDLIDLRNDIRGGQQTIGGIHLNAAGYNQWREAVLSHIRSSLGCTEAGGN
jgi:lysophospholipase L1-like esterase